MVKRNAQARRGSGANGWACLLSILDLRNPSRPAILLVDSCAGSWGTFDETTGLCYGWLMHVAWSDTEEGVENITVAKIWVSLSAGTGQYAADYASKRLADLPIRATNTGDNGDRFGLVWRRTYSAPVPDQQLDIPITGALVRRVSDDRVVAVTPSGLVLQLSAGTGRLITDPLSCSRLPEPPLCSALIAKREGEGSTSIVRWFVLILGSVTGRLLRISILDP